MLHLKWNISKSDTPSGHIYKQDITFYVHWITNVFGI